MATASQAASLSSFYSTAHLYYDDTYLFSCTAKVVSIYEGDDNKTVIVLDQTVMHPQGGEWCNLGCNLPSNLPIASANLRQIANMYS